MTPTASPRRQYNDAVNDFLEHDRVFVEGEIFAKNLIRLLTFKGIPGEELCCEPFHDFHRIERIRS